MIRRWLLAALCLVGCGAPPAPPTTALPNYGPTPSSPPSSTTEDRPYLPTKAAPVWSGAQERYPPRGSDRNEEARTDEEARQWVLRSSTVGCWADRPPSGRACANLGEAHLDIAGQGFEIKPNDAVQAFTRGCDVGYVPACSYLAVEYMGGGSGRLPKSLPRAAGLFEKACSLGDEQACMMTGISIGEGWLDAPNPRKGAAVLAASCKRGLGGSCAALASRLEAGWLGAVARSEVRELFGRACRLGDLESCDRLK